MQFNIFFNFIFCSFGSVERATNCSFSLRDTYINAFWGCFLCQDPHHLHCRVSHRPRIVSALYLFFRDRLLHSLTPLFFFVDAPSSS